MSRPSTAPLPDSGFGELLVRLNGLAAAGFAGWEFLPGMRFGDGEAWWRGGARQGPHEGLDLCLFRTGDGRVARLGAGASVPVAYPGEVVALVQDFLGSSVFVAHGRARGRGGRLHTVYGHLDPRAGLAPGSTLRAGEVVGAVADTAGGRAGVPPHLHLTVAMIARDGRPESLDWRALMNPSRVRLLDPLPIVCGTMRGPRRPP